MVSYKVNVLFLPYDSNDHKNSVRDFIDHTHNPISCDYDVLTHHNIVVFHTT